MSFRSTSTLALAIFVMAGCASVPVPEPSVSLPSQWQEAATSTAVPIDLQRWWTRFADPGLDAAVASALRDEPGLASATARLHAARVLRAHADDAFRPQFGALTSNPIDPDATASFFTAGFDARWELGLFGRGAANRRIAQAALDSSHAEVADARVSLVAEVARNWIDMRAAQARLVLLEQIAVSRSRQIDTATTRVRLRLDAPASIATARAAEGSAGYNVAEMRQHELAARHALASLVGRSEPDPAWSVPGPVPVLPAVSVATVPADLLRARPDILRAQAAVLAAAGELGIARADRFPRVALGGSLLVSTSTSAHRNTPAAEAIGGFGPSIEIPLFDWGMRAAQARARSFQLDAAVQDYRARVFAAAAEVETALGAVELARTREAAVVIGRSVAHQQVAALVVRKRLRLASAADVVEAQATATQQDEALVSASAGRGLAYVALFKALGGAAMPPSTPTAPLPDRETATAR